MYKKTILIIFIFTANLFCTYILCAQTSQVDSLKTRLKNAVSDTVRVRLLNALCEIVEVNDIISFSEPAVRLCEKNLLHTNLTPKEINFYNENLAIAYNNSGFFYNINSNIPLALLNFHNALRIQEKINDKKNVIYTLINIGAVYHSQNESVSKNKRDESMLNKALEYYVKSLKICEEINDQQTQSRCLNDIGLIYDDLGDSENALFYYYKSLSVSNKIDFKESQGISYNNIGYVLYKKALASQSDRDSLFLSAKDIYEKGLKIFKEIHFSIGEVNILQNIGLIYLELKKLDKAQIVADEGFVIARQLGTVDQLKRIYYLYYLLYKQKKEGLKTVEMLEKYMLFKDSMNNELTKNISLKSQLKYQYEKKEEKIKIEKMQVELKAKEDDKRHKIIILSVVIGLIIVFVFTVFLYKSLRQNKKANSIITFQKREVETQKHIVEEKQKEILDSINYAQRIQYSLLASDSLLKQNLKDYFLFFKPKDVVSGDFYWGSKLSNDSFVLVTADSTGHGVPGAIMSMLNMSCLNEAINSEKLMEPADILNATRKKVISHLANDGSAEGGKDGMDCSLCVFDFENKILKVAAAHNPVWIVRETEVIEIKPDKMPVGKHDRQEVPFTQHEIQLQIGDVVYTLTDGFPDQFGGEKGKKFMSKNLRELLAANAHLPMYEQKTLLETTFAQWKGDLEQVDDVTVIGVRI